MKVKNKEIKQYYIVGVKSFGKYICGGLKNGIYKSVKKYVEWIERVVWNRKLKYIEIN
jgi:secreted trypsin-like serine protease